MWFRPVGGVGCEVKWGWGGRTAKHRRLWGPSKHRGLFLTYEEAPPKRPQKGLPDSQRPNLGCWNGALLSVETGKGSGLKKRQTEDGLGLETSTAHVASQ